MQEFGIISKYFAPLCKHVDGAFALQNDACVLAPALGCELVVTQDALSEGTHFFKGDAPRDLAKKLLRVNLSDLAAMGAIPKGYLLSLVMPYGTTSDWIGEFARGLEEDMAVYGGALLGGDTVTHDGPLVLNLTAIGQVKQGKALRRSSAECGDSLFVTGTIGGAAAGLGVLERRFAVQDKKLLEACINRYHLPAPKVAFGKGLCGIVNAVIDISDGLVADCTHICEASGLGAVIKASSVPLEPAARQLVLGGFLSIADVITAGDDYELLASVAQEHKEEFLALAEKVGEAVTEIGYMQVGDGVTIEDIDGKLLDIAQLGYEHGLKKAD